MHLICSINSYLPSASILQVFIASIGSDLIAERMRVAKLLWNANIPAEYSHQDSPKFKKQLDETLERGIPFMVVFGEDEMAKGVVKLKNMREHTEQEVALGALVESLLKDNCTVIPPGTDLGFLSAMRESYV
jgi:histidyl-tRNA synthetase